MRSCFDTVSAFGADRLSRQDDEKGRPEGRPFRVVCERQALVLPRFLVMRPHTSSTRIAPPIAKTHASGSKKLV